MHKHEQISISTPARRPSRRHASIKSGWNTRVNHLHDPVDDRPHLTIADLAVRWQKHPDYLRRAIVGQPAPDGIPEAFKVGSGPRAPWLIPVAAVEAYERRHRVVKTEEHHDAPPSMSSIR